MIVHNPSLISVVLMPLICHTVWVLLGASYGQLIGNRSGRRWIERVTSEDSGEGRQERLALLAESRQIPSDRRIGSGSLVAAEAARDLLLDLESAQIAFRLIVIEGDGQVIEEGERLLLLEQEPFEEVARGRLR